MMGDIILWLAVFGIFLITGLLITFVFGDVARYGEGDE